MDAIEEFRRPATDTEKAENDSDLIRRLLRHGTVALKKEWERVGHKTYE
jgi:hypothetical protein